MAPRTALFISYSRKDKRWLERLQVYLKPYDQRGLIQTWDDKKIKVGDEWLARIQSAIENAAAAVLLLSADFLASDFIVNNELPPLLHKAERGGATILPLYVGPVKLNAYPELARYQAFNVPEKPLSALTKPRADEVLSQFAAEIGEILNSPAPGPPVNAATLFERLYRANVVLSILRFLATSQTDWDLTELTRALKITPRGVAHAAVVELSTAEWILKRRVGDRTRYRISEEGIRQLQQLSKTGSSSPVGAVE